METDQPLKVLFQHCAEMLLPLTGDAGAIVRASGPQEIHTLERRADCVIQLEKEGETYYRHLEFEDRPDPTMARRCFAYNTQLIVQHNAPVLTTVLYIGGPKPKEPLVFRVSLAGREINRWAFEQICLWDMDAEEGLASAVPGLLPLTPLMRGGHGPAIVKEALRRITQAFPPERISIAEGVLLQLAAQHYTLSKLSEIIGRDRMAQLKWYVEALAEGEAKGEAKGEARGRLAGERELCTALAAKHHPNVMEQVRPRIEACEDPARLREWALAASDLSDAEFLRLLEA